MTRLTVYEVNEQQALLLLDGVPTAIVFIGDSREDDPNVLSIGVASLVVRGPGDVITAPRLIDSRVSGYSTRSMTCDPTPEAIAAVLNGGSTPGTIKPADGNDPESR